MYLVRTETGEMYEYFLVEDIEGEKLFDAYQVKGTVKGKTPSQITEFANFLNPRQIKLQSTKIVLEVKNKKIYKANCDTENLLRSTTIYPPVEEVIVKGNFLAIKPSERAQEIWRAIVSRFPDQE